MFAAFALLFSLVPGMSDWLKGMHPAFAFGIQYLIQLVILFFPLWIFVVEPYGARLKDFAFRPVSWKKLLGTVLGLYLFYILLSSGILLILQHFQVALPGYQDQESYLPFFGTDGLGLSLALFTVGLLAPFAEELFFRGFVYRVFTKTWPIWLGSILTAALFALIHFQLQSILPLFLLGLLLNWAYQRTGSVWTAFAFHALNNLIAIGFEIFLSFHPSAISSIIR